MYNPIAFIAVITFFAQDAVADGSNWTLQTTASGREAVLSLQINDMIAYRFACGASDVVVTETGVTKLIDFRDGKPIGDDAGAVMPGGAAVMALYGGKGDPKFQPAAAVKNPAGGWDLTIRVPKNDKQLAAIAKGEIMSLFTTGYTAAVVLNDDARSKWRTFLSQCSDRGQTPK